MKGPVDFSNGIPAELVAKLEKSKYFNQGFATVEYLAACFLDMDADGDLWAAVLATTGQPNWRPAAG